MGQDEGPRKGWEVLSDGINVFLSLLGFGVLGALLMNGWPKFFTITIHKHYHGKEEGKP